VQDVRLLPVLSPRRSWFGDLVILVFLMSQALDGVLTYLGLKQFGSGIEANPLISSALPVLGHGVTVASAKLMAAGCGIVLHVTGVHRVVALLTAFYLAGAVVPWVAILFS